METTREEEEREEEEEEGAKEGERARTSRWGEGLGFRD